MLPKNCGECKQIVLVEHVTKTEIQHVLRCNLDPKKRVITDTKRVTDFCPLYGKE